MKAEEEELSVHPALKTPEILGMILSLSDFEDVKTCRLVNSLWRAAAMHEVKVRGKLRLFPDGENKKSSLIAKSKSLHPGEFRMFVVHWSVPKTFVNLFKDTLTTLHMRDVRFETLNELRQIVFQTFPQLKDLGMVDVLAPSKTMKLESISIDPVTVPKVTKVVIRRMLTGYDGRRGSDVFDTWGFGEIANRFSKTLKELECYQMNAIARSSATFEIFKQLVLNDVHLSHLKYRFCTNEECEAFKVYLETCGDSLTDLRVMHGSVLAPVFNHVFEKAPICQYKYLSIYDQDWSGWQGADFLNLKRVTMKSYKIQSFRFLAMMPNLNIVKISPAFKIPNDYLMYRGNNVHTLRLGFFFREHIVKLAVAFPCVQHLELKSEYFSNDGERYGVLEDVAKAWPEIKKISLSGPYRPPLGFEGETDREIKNGVVNLEDLRHLVKLTCLQTFNVRHSCTIFMWFGDVAAHEVFLKIPSLRAVHVMFCSMSDRMVEVMKAKLAVFTYEKRQINLQP